jgi:hypothetical protein
MSEDRSAEAERARRAETHQHSDHQQHREARSEDRSEAEARSDHQQHREAMTPLDRLLIERSCERLVNDYCRFVDFGEAARMAELFTEDGEWISAGGSMRGRAELLAAFGARQELGRRTSRHVCTNVSIDVLNPHQAVGLCYLINYRHDAAEDGPAMVPAPIDHAKFMGEYHDRFVHTADGWRFASRRCDLAFLRRAKPRS